MPFFFAGDKVSCNEATEFFGEQARLMPRNPGASTESESRGIRDERLCPHWSAAQAWKQQAVKTSSDNEHRDVLLVAESSIWNRKPYRDTLSSATVGLWIAQTKDGRLLVSKRRLPPSKEILNFSHEFDP